MSAAMNSSSGGASVLGEQGGTGAGSEPDALELQGLACGRDALHCALPDQREHGYIDFRRDDRELITADSGHQVSVAHRISQRAGHDNERAIATAEPMSSVHLLEVIQVDQQ